MATVDELKDIVGLVVEMVDCASVVAADGSLGFSDVGAVWSVVEKIGPAFSGVKNIPEELKDLSPAECDELIEFVMNELDTPEPVSKVVVEKALKAVKAAYEV